MIPAADLDLMVKTRVADFLTGDLADDLTGRSDGQSVLERLARRNFFTVELPDEYSPCPAAESGGEQRSVNGPAVHDHGDHRVPLQQQVHRVGGGRGAAVHADQHQIGGGRRVGPYRGRAVANHVDVRRSGHQRHHIAQDPPRIGPAVADQHPARAPTQPPAATIGPRGSRVSPGMRWPLPLAPPPGPRPATRRAGGLRFDGTEISTTATPGRGPVHPAGAVRHRCFPGGVVPRGRAGVSRTGVFRAGTGRSSADTGVASAAASTMSVTRRLP